MTTYFFSLLSFVAVFGSGMGKNQDLGSGINIPDPQHCFKYLLHLLYKCCKNANTSVVNRDHVDPIRIQHSLGADPDLTFSLDADPDPIRHFLLMADPVQTFYLDADLDPTFLFDAESDPDLTYCFDAFQDAETF
jgi:hypothetical protein